MSSLERNILIWLNDLKKNDCITVVAPIAQLVEHTTVNRAVGGSIPPWSALFISFHFDDMKYILRIRNF